jgi:hypothetical protein
LYPQGFNSENQKGSFAMKRFLLATTLACLTLQAAQTLPDDPRYTSDGQLIRPENYREWIYLSSGLGMTYGVVESAANALQSQRFTNVFVTPQAYKRFLQTGAWPDKTVFIMEVRASTSKGSINKGGRYQEELVGLEAHVKDQARFSTGWEFFGFGTGQTARPLGAKSNCQTCHSGNGAVDTTFVQFYPTLIPVAQSKGTLKAQR